MATTEPQMNHVIASVLRQLRRTWSSPQVVRSENTMMLQSSAKRPDILVMEPGTSPVVVETEVLPAQTVEKDARSRLGQVLRQNGRLILSAVAVRMPGKLRTLDGTGLTEAIQSESSFEFACFTGRSRDDAVRWPNRGWIRGGMADLCLICQAMGVPPPIVDDAADRLVRGVGDAAGILAEFATSDETAIKAIAATLKQEDGIQTRRMAMTIVANAFAFHASLAGKGGQLAAVTSLVHLSRTGSVSRADVLAEWKKILAVNYWPIFDISRRIVEFIPAGGVNAILTELASTAQSLLESGVARSHDLVGAIFQKLIADRKFLAAFYTKPASAALLSGMSVLPDQAPSGLAWGDANKIKNLRIGDFACGTGTLLSTAYRFVRGFHEIHGGDETTLHPVMMSDALVGCDIMPAAAHITASMLASAHPSITYGDTSVMTMPYGKQDNGTISLGSLDLLQSQGTFPALATHAAALGATGEGTADTWKNVPDGSFDLVIMNPPFTRSTNHEGRRADIPNPMFAAFETSVAEQKAMSKILPKLTQGTCYSGNAGQATAFVALANRKLKPGGTLAMVLPLGLLGGTDWDKPRALLRQEYSGLSVITIAAPRDIDSSFSADTGMAECLVIATKTSADIKRGLFVSLLTSPSSQLEGAAIARAIRECRGKCHTLEGGPVGGTQVRVGQDVVGLVLDAPVPASGTWPVSRVRDMEVAQAAFQMFNNNRFWLPGMTLEDSTEFTMTPLSNLASIGPVHRDINGTERSKKKGIRGPFEIVDIAPGQKPTYPTLWKHYRDLETYMLVAPDKQGLMRVGNTIDEKVAISNKADRIRKTASRCHFNYGFRYNTQPLGAAYTKTPTIGGRAWPALKFTNVTHEKAYMIWANSTMGILCHWWYADKTQSGRGSITITAIPNVKSLDLNLLTPNQLTAAAKAFDKLVGKPLLRAYQLDIDPTRKLIDRALLVDVLGFPKETCDDGKPLDLLRQKLSREPTISGGRQDGDDDIDGDDEEPD
jgi:surface antigen